MVNSISHYQQPAKTAEPQQQAFDPWLVWVTFRRCWPWAVPAGAVLSSIAAFYILQTFVPTYRAQHLLAANQDYVVFRGVMPSITDMAASEKQWIFNAAVLDPVLADPEARTAPSLTDPDTAEANLRKNLTVTGGGTLSRLYINYEDADRDAAARVCNLVAESYLRQRALIDNERMSRLEETVKPAITEWEENVDELKSKVQTLSKLTLGYSPSERVEAMEDQEKLSLLRDLRARISELKFKLALWDSDPNTSQNQGADAAAQEFVPPVIEVQRREPTEVEIQNKIAADPAVRDAQRLLEGYKTTLLQMELGGTRRTNRGYYQEIEGKRDAQQEKIKKLKESARERALELLAIDMDREFERAKREAEKKIDRLRREFEANQVRNSELSVQEIAAAKADRERAKLARIDQLRVLQDQYNQEKEQVGRYLGSSTALQFAKEDLTMATEVLNKLKGRQVAVQTERATESTVLTLARAVPPSAPVETVPTKKVIMAAGGAFVVPFLLGLLWEFRIQRLTDSAAVEKGTGLARVVGEVAKLPAGTKSGRSRRVFEESIDTLRANLFLSVDTKDTRSIAVCSSMSGEGKSSVASQLALSIAKATGQTVLLVDADMRCPDQHDIFGLDIGPGLSGVLSGKAKFEDAIDKSLGELVHVIPAGRLSCSPHRLINPSSMREFVDGALEQYSFVIVDTAPVLSAGESLAVASSVDATLMCVMRDVSRMDSVKRTTQRLEAAGANVAGTVFSGVTARQYAYRYGDYHYTVPSTEIQA
ncbi:MAG: polysaccharide biosynthesis tyrosine autokinase [Planctomycetota bacterium]